MFVERNGQNTTNAGSPPGRVAGGQDSGIVRSGRRGEESRRFFVRMSGGLTIVELGEAERQFEDELVQELGTHLHRLVTEGRTQLLLNLRGFEYASSFLLGHLAWLHRRVTLAGGALRLCGLEPLLRDALHICSLDREIVIYEDESQAIAACGTGPE